MKAAYFFFALALVALLPRAGVAADPYVVNAVLALTGPGTFIGNEQREALDAVETTVNRAGGIAGRPLRFAVKDDASNPQVAVQLVRDLIAQRVPVILGPSLTASCNAVAPLVQHDGPVVYCLTAGAHPPAGGYVFATLTSSPDLIAVSLRYFRERGLKRIAYLVTTDAGGADAEDGINAAVAAPENRDVTIVAREHFGPSDISVTAQMARIKTARPDVLIAWVAGTATGAALRGERDAGMTIPTLLSSANMTPSFLKQFGALYPPQTYFPAMLYYAKNDVTSAATRAAISRLNYAATTAGIEADQVFISAWDPAMMIVDLFKRLGFEATPARIKETLARSKGWVGVNGPYDFRTIPQRGIGQDAVVMVRWDAGRSQYDPVSALGGAPLRTRLPSEPATGRAAPVPHR